MGEKIYVTIPIDEDIFFNFSKAVKSKGKSKYAIIEYLMQRYINTIETPPPSSPPVDPFKLTEELLEKWQPHKIGQLANNVLRGLLERGVATDYEINEFQKANGNKTVDKLQIGFGMYVNKNFGLPFPLLITEEHLRYDAGNNFFVSPLEIDDNEYYLCSQWVDKNHREKLEAWIRKSLPAWFERTDEDSRNEMINWIENF